MSYCFVRIETDDGLVGFGEVCDSYGCSYARVVGAIVEDAYAPLLVGQPITAVEPMVERLRLATRRRLGDHLVTRLERGRGGLRGAARLPLAGR